MNTIGYSLSLVPNVDVENNWTKDHFKLAEDGALYYYEGKNLEAIEQIVEKLRKEAHGSREVFVTILPISFYYTDAFFTLPLYRFRPSQNDKDEKFMDHTGRVYSDFEDWRINNNLPATKILYPKDGHLKLMMNEEKKPHCVLEDSAECSRSSKTLMAMDVASGALGIMAGIGATVVTGGAALLMMGGMALSATYGAGRASYKLHDRAKHSESINPFKSREAFWCWLGLGADVITFGSIGAASTKILSSISQSAAFLDITKKFASATRAMTLFQGVARPATDSAKALMTGYEIFAKLRHKSSKEMLKIPKSALANISSALEEFSKTNMMLMAISSGYWSKSKMSYVSPEDFHDMIHEATLQHLVEECSNESRLQSSINLIQNDVEVVKCYHQFEGEVDDFVSVIHDVFSHDENQFVVTLNGDNCEITIDEQFVLKLGSLAMLTESERKQILKILGTLNDEEKLRLSTIQDFAQSNVNFVRMILFQNFKDLLDIWYDIFVICSDQCQVSILDDKITLKDIEITMEILQKLSREERLNLVFNLKNFDDEQIVKFNQLIATVPDPEHYYRMLTSEKDEKESLIAILDYN